MWITILLAVLLCLSIGYSIYQKRKTYRLIDRLLDSVLNREMIAASDVEEGEYSALVSKISTIGHDSLARNGAMTKPRALSKSLRSYNRRTLPDACVSKRGVSSPGIR